LNAKLEEDEFSSRLKEAIEKSSYLHRKYPVPLVPIEQRVIVEWDRQARTKVRNEVLAAHKDFSKQSKGNLIFLCL
jgi:hypothetical protein